jgi:riboflavin kinase/FMN adenylyltransferase
MMRIFRSLEDAAGRFGPCALTIGNFDGVHAGHRQILQRVKAVAEENGWTASVLTFDPHPTRIVAPERSPRLMTTPERRCELMATEGIEQALILPFTRTISELSPEEFTRRILVETLETRAVLVGENFRFGHRQTGDVTTLGSFGNQYGFTTEVIPAVKVRGIPVSSSTVRNLVELGQVGRGWRLLGRPFALQGEVVRGRGVGAKQTVPTLNLASDTDVLPAHGVYVTCTLDLDTGRRWASITNVGHRPTFDAGEVSVETFLLEPLADAAPRRIRVDFLRRVREEIKFESPDALKQQIFRDVGRAQTYFRRLNRGAAAGAKLI